MSKERFSTLATAYNIDGRVSLTFVPPPGAGDVLDPLWLRTNAVRITIEPADAEPPDHESALDTLAELKGVITGLIMGHAAAPAEAREAVLRRAMELATRASLELTREGG